MKVQIRYFAWIREALGSAESIDVADNSTVGGVRDALIAIDERHATLLARGRAVRVALNQMLCDESVPVTDGAELAFFPPLTGG